MGGGKERELKEKRSLELAETHDRKQDEKEDAFSTSPICRPRVRQAGSVSVEGGAEKESDSCSVSERCHRFISGGGGPGEGWLLRGGIS